MTEEIQRRMFLVRIKILEARIAADKAMDDAVEDFHKQGESEDALDICCELLANTYNSYIEALRSLHEQLSRMEDTE